MTFKSWQPSALLRHPPDDAVVLGVVYLLIGFGAWSAMSVHDADPVDATIALAATFLGIVGGLAGAVAQLRALWFIERGAIWAVWASLIVRSTVVAFTGDASIPEILARTSALLALCVVLVSRYREIQGADQNPSV